MSSVCSWFYLASWRYKRKIYFLVLTVKTASFDLLQNSINFQRKILSNTDNGIKFVPGSALSCYQRGGFIRSCLNLFEAWRWKVSNSFDWFAFEFKVTSAVCIHSPTEGNCIADLIVTSHPRNSAKRASRICWNYFRTPSLSFFLAFWRI